MTRAGAIAALAFALASAQPAAVAAGPELGTRTHFTIDVTLTLGSASGTPTTRTVTLAGVEGAPLAGTAAFGDGPRALRVDVRVLPRLDARGETAQLTIEAVVTPPAQPALSIARDAAVGAGRVRFVELWRGRDPRELLVAAFVARWKSVPIAGPQTASEAVSIDVELRESDATIERHVLPTLLGQSVRLEVRRTSDASDAASALVEVTPRRASRSELDIAVRITVEGAAASASASETPATPFVVEARERVPDGASLVLPLPDAGDGRTRTIVVTARR